MMFETLGLLLVHDDPLFRVARTQADEAGLSSVFTIYRRSKNGASVRVTFRAPNYRHGDHEVVYRWRELTNKPRRQKRRKW